MRVEYPARYMRISTHALTEGDHHCVGGDNYLSISTHALTEGDVIFDQKRRYQSISTHALTEGDLILDVFPQVDLFQLTPSRRATANLDKFFF